MAAGEILAVDLPAFERGDEKTRRQIVSEVRESLETGFVYVRHDMAEETIDEAYAKLKEFFALDWETKEQYTVEGSFGQTGYTGLLVETATDSAAADWKEMLNWGPELPLRHPLRERYAHRYMPRAFPEARVPGIRAILGELHDKLFDLQRRFLHIIALGVGAHEEFFEGMLRDGPTLTRAIRYPPMPDAPKSKEHVWAAAHGDINLITALPRATAKGLQVRQADGWIDAVAPAGHAIINTGLMLERLTNGVIPTGVHRVVAEPGETGERFSVVQFCHPTPWTVLSPVPTCVDSAHPLRESPIMAGDWLDQVLYDINLVEEKRP
ncbi:MAG: isopenicillin N synthase family dioxygenase [Planctomycetota bacterium]|jgi:isopenicillin N synthase-like dioxygenase